MHPNRIIWINLVILSLAIQMADSIGYFEVMVVPCLAHTLDIKVGLLGFLWRSREAVRNWRGSLLLDATWKKEQRDWKSVLGQVWYEQPKLGPFFLTVRTADSNPQSQ